MKQGMLMVIELASVPQPALMQRARAVATALQLGVYVGCLRDDSDLPPPLPGRRQHTEDLRARVRSRSRLALERRLEAMRADGIDAEGSVALTDSVSKSVLQLVREHAPAIVMIARKSHTGFEQATLGGDDFAILRECPVPVWVVHPSRHGGEKILGAVGKPGPRTDGPSLDDRILDETALLAQKLGKESHAVHAFGAAGSVSPLERAADDPMDDMGTSRNDARIEGVLAFVQAHGVAPEHAHIYEGKLERVLEEEAGPLNADLIVLGSSCDGRLKRLLSGGTTEKIIDHADTDVLVLKGETSVAPPPRV
jgi:universal stress protein E